LTNYDVHAHCIPENLVDMLRVDGPEYGIEVVSDEKGESAVIAERIRLAPFRSMLGDTEARLAAMDASSVDVQVISSWVDLTAYALDPGRGARYSRRVNQIIADHAAEHPDRLLALGTVPLQGPEQAAEELRFAVEDLRMVGVEIATTIDDADLDRAGLDPFWEAAESLGCFVLLHPCNPLPGVDLARYFLDNMVGRPAESTIAMAGLLFGGVLERFPDLKICMCHGGGFVPFQIGRMERGFVAASQRTRENISTPPSELARRLYYDTVLHDSKALGFLVDQVGAERVMMGSDYPFEMGDPEPVKTVDAIPEIDDAQRQLILGGNFARILEEMGRA
jgi:aminocarboxymuconate-semialdehyde decarboxylase